MTHTCTLNIIVMTPLSLTGDIPHQDKFCNVQTTQIAA